MPLFDVFYIYDKFYVSVLVYIRMKGYFKNIFNIIFYFFYCYFKIIVKSKTGLVYSVFELNRLVNWTYLFSYFRSIFSSSMKWNNSNHMFYSYIKNTSIISLEINLLKLYTTLNYEKHMVSYYMLPICVSHINTTKGM